MHRPPMAIGKDMKRLLGKSPRKEASTSMAPMETEATSGTIFIKGSFFLPLLIYLGGVDLRLVIDEVSFSQGVSP